MNALFRRHLLAAFVAAAFPAMPSWAETLPAVVDRILLQQPSVRSAQALLNAAKSQVTQARSEFLPTASVGYRNSNGHDETQGFAFERTVRRSDATLRWNIFNGGADVSRLRSSSFNQDAADADLDEVLERVAAEITENYADVVRLRQTMVSLEATIARQESLQKRVAQRVEAGRIPPSELDLVRVRLIQNRNNLGLLRSQLGTAEYRYRLLTGQTPNGLVFPAILPPDKDAGEEFLIERIRQNNPRLRAARQRVAARGAEIGIARGSLMPAVDVEITKRLSNRTDPIPVTDSSGNEMLRVNLDVPLGGKNFARYNEAGERHRAAVADAEQLDHELTRDASDLYRQAREARAMASMLEERVLSAQRVAAAYELHFEAGRRSLNDLSIAQDDLYDAQRSLLENHARQAILQAQVLSMQGELRAALHSSYRAAPIAPGLLGTEPAEPAKSLLPANPESTIRGVSAMAEPPAVAANPSDDLGRLVERWADRWSARDFLAYRAFYVDDFKPPGGTSTSDWETERQRRLAQAKTPSIRIEALETLAAGKQQMRTRFIQHYQAGQYRDVVRKELLWIKQGNNWRIAAETILSATP